VRSAREACAAANVRVTQTVSLSRRMRRWDNPALSKLHQTPPDLILLVGGADTGPVEPIVAAANVIETVYAGADPEQRPLVVYAGNQEARRPVSDVLSTSFDLRVVENVSPEIETENLLELQRELCEVYRKVKLPALPGYRRLRDWCDVPLLSTPEAVGSVLRYIARRNELPQGVLGVDVGGSTTYVGAANAQEYQWTVGSDLGTSLGARGTLELSGVADIGRWLPTSVPDEETLSRLENVHLRPQGIPQTMEDLLLVHAVARQDLLLAMREMRLRDRFPAAADRGSLGMPGFDVIAARGGVMSHTPQDGIVALTLLDAIQPVGLSRVVVDWASMWAQLGAVATLVPRAAAQVFECDGLRELGTIIAPSGEARNGGIALRLTIRRDEGEAVRASIPAGTVRRFPLGLEESAVVEVRPSHEFDIGMGRRGMGGKARVRGGSLGIIVDTRGRPLAVPQNAFQRREKLQEWLENLVGDVPDVS